MLIACVQRLLNQMNVSIRNSIKIQSHALRHVMRSRYPFFPFGNELRCKPARCVRRTSVTAALAPAGTLRPITTAIANVPARNSLFTSNCMSWCSSCNSQDKIFPLYQNCRVVCRSEQLLSVKTMYQYVLLFAVDRMGLLAGLRVDFNLPFLPFLTQEISMLGALKFSEHVFSWVR